MNVASVQVQQILTSIYGNFIFIFPSKIIESLRRRHSFLAGDSRSRATCVMHEVCWTTCSVFTQACLQEVSVWAEGRSQSITAAAFRSDKVANACYQPPPAKWISLQKRRWPSTVVSVVVCSFVFFFAPSLLSSLGTSSQRCVFPGATQDEADNAVETAGITRRGRRAAHFRNMNSK